MRGGIHKVLGSSVTGLLLIGVVPALAGNFTSAALEPVRLKDVPATVVASSSPDNSHQTFKDVIDGAKRTLNIAVYIFRCDLLTDHIVAALDRGVRVRVLLDGWPVGSPRVQKVDEQSLYIAKRLKAKGADVRFLYSDRGPRDDRRFKYLHAKYAVADGETLYVTSENVGSNSGHPVSGTTGNRGWTMAITNTNFAKAYNNIFDNDWKGDDVVPYGGNDDYVLHNKEFEPSRKIYSGTYRPVPSVKVTEAMDLERVMSPDDSSARGRAILGAIKKAKTSLFIQQLSFAPHWGSDKDSVETDPSPLAEEVLAAARRGVKVRVMLSPPFVPKKNEPSKPEDDEDDDSTGGGTAAAAIADMGVSDWFQFFSSALPNAFHGGFSTSSTRDNRSLLEYFREVASRENLDLQAHFFWVTADGIRTLHNKGMVIDNNKVLVSSVNWVENSVKNNREAAVLVSNAKVASYYHELFERDWRYNKNNR